MKDFHDPVFDIVFYHCESCEFIFKRELDIIDEKDEIKIYEYHNNSIEDEHYVEYFKAFLDNALFKYVSKKTAGLDFGSGPSPVLAEILNRDYNCQMEIYDLYYSPEKVYEGKTYDFVTSTEVIEHLREPLKYFNLFNSLLDVGNILGIMTLFHENSVDKFLKWHYRRDMTHISFYTPKTLETIADKSGFRLVYHDDHRYAIFEKLNDIQIIQ